MCKSSRGFQNEQLETQNLWLVTSTWTEAKVMKPMLIKGWEKIALTRAWDADFQLAALETNTTIVLFTTMLEIKEAIDVVDDFNKIKKNCNHHGTVLVTHANNNFKHNCTTICKK